MRSWFEGMGAHPLLQRVKKNRSICRKNTAYCEITQSKAVSDIHICSYGISFNQYIIQFVLLTFTTFLITASLTKYLRTKNDVK